MMKRKRAEASFPISSLITRSVTIWSVISTRSNRRVFGFSVVSQRTLGIISPSPLNRVISGLPRPLACCFRIWSRWASSSAQWVCLPMSIR